MKIFLAAATGAIGKRLVPLLVKAGHTVTGTTRNTDKAEAIRTAGAAPAVVDALDAKTVREGRNRAVLRRFLRAGKCDRRRRRCIKADPQAASPHRR